MPFAPNSSHASISCGYLRTPNASNMQVMSICSPQNSSQAVLLASCAQVVRLMPAHRVSISLILAVATICTTSQLIAEPFIDYLAVCPISSRRPDCGILRLLGSDRLIYVLEFGFVISSRMTGREKVRAIVVGASYFPLFFVVPSRRGIDRNSQ